MRFTELLETTLGGFKVKPIHIQDSGSDDELTEQGTLKDTSLAALMQAKQDLEQKRAAEIAAWEQDFRKNTAQRAGQQLKRAFEPAPVAQPGEKHSVLKGRLDNLNVAIKKQQALDALSAQAEKMGLLNEPGIRADLDTSMYARDGARDSYVTLNNRLNTAIERVKNRIAQKRAAYSKPRTMNESAAIDAWGYVYNRRDQRVMWRKTFASEQEAQAWADKKNATILGTKPAANVNEALKLNAPGRTISRDELQGYANRIKTGTKTKRDKFSPIIHASNIKAITKDDNNTEWNLDDLAKQITTRPRAILGTNAKMEKSKTEGEIIYDLTLPALSGIVVDEGTGDFVEIATCPGAGSCQLFCYARKGGYVMFPASSMSAAQALNFLVNDPVGYNARVNEEIKTIKTKTDKAGVQLVVRWHDAGDFFSKEYLDLAYDVARSNPDVQFYAYTKMGDVATGKTPANFIINFSSGSKRGEEKKVEFHKGQGNVVKQGVTVPKDMFFDLIARKGNSLIKDAKGRTQFSSPESLEVFKDRLAKTYKVDPDTIITYDQMLKTPIGPDPRWNVIVQPGAGDRAANRKDVIDSYLMFH